VDLQGSAIAAESPRGKSKRSSKRSDNNNEVDVMKHITCSGIGIALLVGLLGLSAGAQNQASSNSQSSASSQSSSGPSLGDYARQIRKTPAATSKPKVFDNDNLPTGDKLSIVGQAPPPPSETTGEAKPAESGTSNAETAKASTEAKTSEATEVGQRSVAGAKTPEEEENERKAAAKQWGDKLSAQKDQISLLTRELDVLQREYQIRAAAMYADAGNRMRNEAAWDQEDAKYKQQIADKQKALDDAKQKLDDMQDEARKAGVPSSALEP
jgi:hypothetical protein